MSFSVYLRSISLGLAALFTILVVAQLFTFEKFPDVIASTSLPGSQSFALLYAAVIVILEVLALPFLLSMPLGRTIRVISMLAGWLVVSAWFKISLWQNLSSQTSGDGLLGATVSLPAGWWTVLFTLILAGLVLWVARKMWPFADQKT